MTSMKRCAGVVWLCLCLSGAVLAGEPVSGFEFLSAESKAMQNDDFENPGYLTVERGRALFNAKHEDEVHTCADCHGEQGEKLNPGELAKYPVFDPALGGLVTLQDRIGYCWETNLDRFPLPYDDEILLAFETFIRNLANGETVKVQTSGPMRTLIAKGEKLYRTRYGQLDMACLQCHVTHQGQRLRGQTLSQGQANGFPVYRLAKGEITSLQKRFRECFISFRADPFDPGSEEYKLLELFVMQKGNGLKIETPAIRY